MASHCTSDSGFVLYNKSHVDHRIDPTTAGLWTSLAAVGGMVRFVAKAMLDDKVHSPSRFCLFLAGNCFVSGFSGLMGALAASEITSDWTARFFVAGIFGYLGIEGLEIVAKMVKAKFAFARDDA